MNKRTAMAAFCAVMAVFAFSATAVTQDIQTPPPSQYADTESTFGCPHKDWLEIGRHVKLWLSFFATPSNNVQVAFGKDANADGILAPEEMQLITGFDCGTWFVRDERANPSRSLVLEDWVDADHPFTGQQTNRLTKMIHLRQVSQVSDRFDFAQVTTRGRGESAAQIAARIFRPGVALTLR